MPDVIQTVTNVGWGQRLMGSFVGVIIGIGLLCGGCGVLFWNEGRAGDAQELLQAAKQAPEVNAATPNTSYINQLVAASGIVTTADSITDTISVSGKANGTITIQPTQVLQLERQVEMYAWEEKSITTTNENFAKPQTRTTNYSYSKNWTAHPADSSTFHEPGEHTNPSLAVQPATITASAARIGDLKFNPQTIDLPESVPLIIDKTIVNFSSPKIQESSNSDFIFVGKGSLAAPRIGDVRVKYSVVKIEPAMTILGTLMSQNTLESYEHKNGHKLYRLFVGDKNTALKTMQNENTLFTWVLRVAGFVMIWLGLAAILGPISATLSIIPLLGSLSRGIIGLVCGIIAFVLSVVLIILSKIAHSWVAIGVIGVILFGLLIWLLTVRRRSKSVAV